MAETNEAYEEDDKASEKGSWRRKNKDNDANNQEKDVGDKGIEEGTDKHTNKGTDDQKDKDTTKDLLGVSYDELMTMIGEFGPRQFVIFLAYAMGIFVEVMVVMTFVFAAGNHNSHHCREPGLERLNLSADLSKNISGGNLDGCHMYLRNYSDWSMQTVQDWIDNYPNVTSDVVQCQHGYVFDAYPYEDTIITEWNLVCGDEWKAYLPYSIMGVGEAVGSLFWGVLIDRFGRMKPFLYSMFALVFLSLGSSFSPHYTAYCLIQFFIGIHAVAAYCIGPTATVEISGVRVRGHLLTAYNYFWTLGNLVLPLVAFLIRRWSRLQICISLLSLVSLSLLIFIKESPRWLYSKGRSEEASQILKTIARSNKRDFPEELNVVIEEDKGSKISFLDLFSSRTLVCICVVLCVAWFSNSLLYFGLSLYLPSMSQDPHLNYFISGLVEIPGYLIAQLCIEYVSRRVAVSGLFACAGVCLVVLLPVHGKDMITLEIALALGGKMLATSLMSVLGCFTSEIFPTVARGSGLFLCILFSNLANILAPQFNLLNKIVPPIIFASFAFFSSFVCLFLPETKNYPLCDTVEEMKKQRKLVSLRNFFRFGSKRKIENSSS